MKAKIDVELELPQLPNFVRIKAIQVEGSVGTTGKGVIDVADLSDDDLRALAHEWGNALFQHARARRERPAELKPT